MPGRTLTEHYTDTIKRRELFEALRDPEYRRAFADDVGTGLAFQIRALREDRGWTQEELANRTGKRQETISLWESPGYGRHTLSTVKDLAAAFDVAPVVRFGAFRELVDWTIQLTPERIAPKSFAFDLVDVQTAFYGSASGDATITITLDAPIYQLTDQIYSSASTMIASPTLAKPAPVAGARRQYALAA